MKAIIHRADTRGHANFGWLDTNHTFSFSNYFNPERVHFGVLRVLNDDFVAGGQGFGLHPHDNMEIVSIPISGSLEHQDTMGNKQVISAGEVQIMSAGSGLQHQEYNHSSDEVVNFLQIWILPKERNITPRYEQKKYDVNALNARWVEVVSPETSEDAIWINQDAHFYLTKVGPNEQRNLKISNAAHGTYFFVIDGQVDIEGQILNKRDGMGVIEGDEIQIKGVTDAFVLAMEVTMELPKVQ